MQLRVPTTTQALLSDDKTTKHPYCTLRGKYGELIVHHIPPPRLFDLDDPSPDAFDAQIEVAHKSTKTKNRQCASENRGSREQTNTLNRERAQRTVVERHLRLLHLGRVCKHNTAQP